MSKSRITLYQYLAWNRPDESMDVIKSFGYHANPRDVGELITGLQNFALKEGEDGLNALARIHPDRELILGASKNFGFDAETTPVIQAPATQVSQPSLERNMIREPNQTQTTQLLIGGLIASALFISAAIIAKS